MKKKKKKKKKKKMYLYSLHDYGCHLKLHLLAQLLLSILCLCIKGHKAISYAPKGKHCGSDPFR